MKKYYLFVVAVAAITFSPSVFAQQQINNDGAGANELQPQSQNVQNNAGNQQGAGSDINSNIGNNDVLRNANVDSLNVIGAPAGITTQEPDRGLASWLVFGAGFLLILMAPALLYAREIRNRTNRALPAEGVVYENTSADEPEISDAVDSDEQADETENESKESETKKSKDKSKKKSGKKSKRSKKKK